MGIGHQTFSIHVRLVAVSVMAVFLVGCAMSGTPKSVAMEGTIVVGENLNPNYQGRPSPLHLSVYQLTESGPFTRASFEELTVLDSAVLGGTSLRRQSFELCPREMGREPLGGDIVCQGDRLPILLDLQPGVRFVGVVAEFFDLLDPAGNWRSIAVVPLGRGGSPAPSAHLNITLQRATVSARFD